MVGMVFKEIDTLKNSMKLRSKDRRMEIKYLRLSNSDYLRQFEKLPV